MILSSESVLWATSDFLASAIGEGLGIRMGGTME